MHYVPTTILLLHYFGGAGRTWRHVIARLPADARVRAPDLRGFGLNHSPGGYRVDDYADQALGLLAGAPAERLVIAGHSLGAKVALAVAARRPPGLVGLLLLAPSPPVPEPMDDDDRRRLLQAYGNRDAIARHLRTIAAAPIAPALMAQAIDDNLRAQRAAWRHWLLHGSRESIASRLGALAAPVRVLLGAHDSAITRAVAERDVLRHLPHDGVAVDVLPNVGHLIPLEAPEAVADALASLL